MVALVGGAQREQVVGEIRLRGAQLTALGRGTGGARPGRVGGTRPGQAGGRAMHGKRDATALRGELCDRERLAVGGQVEPRYLLYGVVMERAELEGARPDGLRAFS
jgi:hypothetical protein